MSQRRAKSIKRKIKNVKARRDVKRRRAKKDKARAREKNVTRRISKARFEALSYARAPLIKLFSEEVEWYSNPENSILGVILIDKSDADFSVVLLGRDEVGVFRYIDGGHSIESIKQARNFLTRKIEFYSTGSARVFPQGLSKKKKQIIFDPIVSEDVMHEDYKVLASSPFFFSS